MNRNTIDTFMKDQNLLTSHGQKLMKKAFDRVGHYNWVRQSKTEWLVCHKNTFKFDESKTLVDLRIGQPHFANIHRVSANEQLSTLTCRSHKTRARLGVPCACIMTVLPYVDPSITHPRYLKMYNSWMYDTNTDVKASIDKLFKVERISEPNRCDITSITDQIPKFEEIVFSPDTTETDYLQMKHLDRLHMGRQYHIRGNELPIEEYDDVSMGSFDMSIGYEGNLSISHGANIANSNIETNNSDSRMEMYAYFESFQKDILKTIGNDSDNFRIAKGYCEKALADIVQSNTKKMKLKPKQTDKIVSSQGETEKSPLQKRFKRFYEG